MDLTDAIAVLLEHYPELQAIWCFGSRATGMARPDSDLDLALLLEPNQARDVRSLGCTPCVPALSLKLGLEIDLLNLRQLSTVVQLEVIRSGQVIHVADQEALLAFEMQVLSAYQKLNEERSGILKSFHETKRAYPV
ncbi:MAG: nucleotidyltransferase domain-containing protein [Opitutales bacterium]|nr:nucleotidyltransferase domain-containing protein [Opitutales bacterium]NRA27227.1 nucleotidyltransferase domain-containing protein [Opitutales bacterium]